MGNLNLEFDKYIAESQSGKDLLTHCTDRTGHMLARTDVLVGTCSVKLDDIVSTCIQRYRKNVANL